jgi:hypothetical protein
MNPAYPVGSDSQSQAPAHIRMIKGALRETFRLNFETYDMDWLEGLATNPIFPVGAMIKWDTGIGPAGVFGNIPDGWILPTGQTFTRSDNGEEDTAPNIAQTPPESQRGEIYIMKT